MEPVERVVELDEILPVANKSNGLWHVSQVVAATTAWLSLRVLAYALVEGAIEGRVELKQVVLRTIKQIAADAGENRSRRLLIRFSVS